jgi:hypothetical protein
MLLAFLGGLDRCFFLLDGGKVSVQLADECPVLSVGHFGDLKDLIARRLTSKEMLRMSSEERASCSRRRLLRWSLGDRGIMVILADGMAEGK